MKRHTQAEIEASAYRHGRDGIRYYPPSAWAEDAPQFVGIPQAATGVDHWYRDAYIRGQQDAPAGATLWPATA